MFERLHIAFANFINGAAERLEGYKTAIVAAALFLVGLLNVIDPRLIEAVLPDEYKGWAFLLVPVAIYILRQLTQTRSRVPGFRPRPRENGTEGTF